MIEGSKTKILGSGGFKSQGCQKSQGIKMSEGQNVGGSKIGGSKKSGTHKLENKSILMHIVPMYKRERVSVLVTASSLSLCRAKNKRARLGFESRTPRTQYGTVSITLLYFFCILDRIGTDDPSIKSPLL